MGAGTTLDWRGAGTTLDGGGGAGSGMWGSRGNTVADPAPLVDIFFMTYFTWPSWPPRSATETHTPNSQMT